jgi:aconitate hydratase
VAYALAGSMLQDITSEPLGMGDGGRPVYLKDVWPTPAEVDGAVRQAVTAAGFKASYADVFAGDAHWAAIGADNAAMTYSWNPESTYIQLPPYFAGMSREPAQAAADIKGARILALLGDSITTDHISPAGGIAKTSPAAKYLAGRGVEPKDFNQYGARRGSHDVMMRGTFANIRIRNEMLGGKEGGWTKLWPAGEEMPIYDAAMAYKDQGVPLVVVGGKEYGTGSSRDWAAKGTNLLGVKAVLAESFERIHRSNLVGMGVLPLVFTGGTDRKSLRLDGSETIDVVGLAAGLRPRMELTLRVHRADGSVEEAPVQCRVDTLDEVDYFKNGGILHYVLRQLLARSEAAGRAS